MGLGDGRWTDEDKGASFTGQEDAAPVSEKGVVAEEREEWGCRDRWLRAIHDVIRSRLSVMTAWR